MDTKLTLLQEDERAVKVGRIDTATLTNKSYATVNKFFNQLSKDEQTSIALDCLIKQTIEAGNDVGFSSVINIGGKAFQFDTRVSLVKGTKLDV